MPTSAPNASPPSITPSVGPSLSPTMNPSEWTATVPNTDAPSLSPTVAVQVKFRELNSLFGVETNTFLGVFLLLWLCSLISCYMCKSSHGKLEEVDLDKVVGNETVAGKDTVAGNETVTGKDTVAGKENEIQRWPSVDSVSHGYSSATSPVEIENPAVYHATQNNADLETVAEVFIVYE